MTISDLGSKLKLNIGARLAIGFAAVALALAIAVATTLVKVEAIGANSNRVVQLRVPTAAASGAMVNDINASLAALRGWMLTGNPLFKIERAAVWTDIGKVRADMDRLSESWTNPKNVEQWNGFKGVLDEFQAAQQKVEDIANTPEEQPATLVLVTEAAPRAAIIIAEITRMIDEEAGLAATPERKALLGMMADVRGSMGMGLANIRAYLLTGNDKFQAGFTKMWAKNEKRFADLGANGHLFTAGQQKAFDALAAARAEFAPLPPKMFEIRGSKKWNMANYLLITEAAPRAGKLLTVLAGSKQDDGTRAGGMADNQKQLLNNDAAAGNAEIGQLVTIEWILLVTGLAVAAAVAFFTGRAIVTPVKSMTAAMGLLAEGDKSVEIPARDRKDEIGEMAQAVQVFKDNAIRMEEMAKEQAEADRRAAEEKEKAEEEKRRAEAERLEAERQAEEEKRAAEQRVQEAEREAERQKAEEAAERQREAEERAKRLEALIQAFDTQVTEALETVSSAATEMQATAQSMSATAEESSRQSTAVATASEQASSNVQTVATAAEELSTSIAEISNQVAQSAKIAEEAVREAERTNSTVQGLAEAAGKIGDVVGLINDIAGQTNLLALNATIEAARAGEAGKGFAVVASEVKNLANQTAKATNEISGQIGDIQAATEGAVGAIQGIGATIAKINEIASSIASAVEEQGAATSEISRNVQEAAKGTQEVTDNITGVTQAAAETGSAANQVLGTAEEMAQQSTTLREQVETFLTQIRAA